MVQGLIDLSYRVKVVHYALHRNGSAKNLYMHHGAKTEVFIYMCG